MKFNLDSIQYNKSNTYMICPEGEFDGMISLVCDNEAFANAIYNGIASSRSRKKFSSEDFNEVLDQALTETRIPVKQCNLALVIFNQKGCFVAQMGDTRILQIRPITQEIMHDSRSQVLDIYSSKAKVEQIQDIKTDDYFLLSSSDCIDEKNVRKVLSNMINDHDAKVNDLVSMMESTKDCNGDTPAFVLTRALNVKKGVGINFKKLNPKHFLIAIVALAIVGAGVWAYSSLSFESGQKEEEEIPADSLVSTQASNNNVDTTMVKVPETIDASQEGSVVDNSADINKDSIINVNKPMPKKTVSNKKSEPKTTGKTDSDSASPVEAPKEPAPVATQEPTPSEN